MKSVHKSVLIWYSAKEMFDLVTDVDAYPQFLPWCDHARVLADDGREMTAEIGVSFGGIRQSFTTRNRHMPGREVHMQLVEGLFSSLDGRWTFTPVGSADQRSCKVELNLAYGFRSAGLAALAGPLFDKIAGNLVDAFVTRAEQVHG